MHPRPERNHVGVVVFPRQLRHFHRPRQSRATPVDQVRRHLLAVTGTTQDHAQGALVRDHTLGAIQTKRRIVVLGIKEVRAVVDDFVAVGASPINQVLLHLETGVVGSKVEAHENLSVGKAPN